MRIIIVNETSDLGGAESMATELANAICAIPENQVAFASAPGVMQKRLEDKIQFFPISRYNHWNIFKLFLEFASIFRKNRFEIMHSQGATVAIIAGIAAKVFSPKTKIVITHHSSAFSRVPSGIAIFLFKAIGDTFISISKAKYDSFMRAGFNRKKVALIPNFVNKERLFYQASAENVKKLKDFLKVMPEEKVIVGIGRLLPGKRFNIFIKSLIDCAKQAPEIKIFGIIVGDGPERELLQRMIDRQNLPNLRFKMEGFQDNVAAYLKIAEIFLFTTEQEVLPMCLIEATSLGVPVVCSDIAGNNDIIENAVNGFLVDRNEDNYSDYILRILRDESLAKNFSANGIEKGKKSYDKNKIAADIFSVYKSLMKHSLTN